MLLALVLLLQAPSGAAPGPATAAAPDQAEAAAPEPRYDHVLLVSVDGLRADALRDEALGRLPQFRRLLDGAATLDARTDPDDTRTSPNHVGMLTGRTKLGPDGHRWELNSTPPPKLVVADVRGGPTAGVFDVLAAHGARGAVYASKEKFLLFPRSWADVAAYHYSKDAALQVEAAGQWLEARAAAGERSFALLHFAGPDTAGHAHGWDADPDSAYADSVRAVDARLGELLAFLDARPALRARTALVLTTDHGGGVPHRNHHGEGRAAVNFTIPFLVWSGDGRAAGDLYALNPGLLAAPGAADPGVDAAGPPPLRNLDAGNLCLDLLGLPAIPGSTVGAHQQLRVRE